MSINPNDLLKKQPLLLFDGECGFCNRAVLFFLKREKNTVMHFVSLESPEGIALKRYFEIDNTNDTLILIRDHSAFIKSCAALRLTQYMRGFWPLLSVFVIIPPFLRNIVYNAIAKRRMRFFGRVNSCELLRDVDKERFFS